MRNIFLLSSPVCYNWITSFLSRHLNQSGVIMSITTSLVRGLLLRCPNCGRGRLFRRGFTMYEKCSVCGLRFEREEGYWTGAIALNLSVMVVILVCAMVPLAIVF